MIDLDEAARSAGEGAKEAHVEQEKFTLGLGLDLRGVILVCIAAFGFET